MSKMLTISPKKLCFQELWIKIALMKSKMMSQTMFKYKKKLTYFYKTVKMSLKNSFKYIALLESQ